MQNHLSYADKMHDQQVQKLKNCMHVSMLMAICNYINFMQSLLRDIFVDNAASPKKLSTPVYLCICTKAWQSFKIF